MGYSLSIPGQKQGLVQLLRWPPSCSFVGSDRPSQWPVTNCGLRLDNEAIRVGIGLRLGSKLCEPHTCPCGASVDASGTHGLACKKGAGRITRHHHINDLVQRALVRASIPSVKEPVGLLRSNGKRPDDLALIPWQGGKSLTWDVTVSDTLARSYIPTTSVTQGGSAEAAASSKEANTWLCLALRHLPWRPSAQSIPRVALSCLILGVVSRR